jgi:hypothetical protein
VTHTHARWNRRFYRGVRAAVIIGAGMFGGLAFWALCHWSDK